MRACIVMFAAAERTSTFDVESENDRKRGGTMSPMPLCENDTPGAPTVAVFPTSSTSVTLSTTHVPCSDQRGKITGTL